MKFEQMKQKLLMRPNSIYVDSTNGKEYRLQKWLLLYIDLVYLTLLVVSFMVFFEATFNALIVSTIVNIVFLGGIKIVVPFKEVNNK